MKGIVFNLLAEAVSQQYGDDTWDNLLDAADLDGAYTSLGNYPDTDIVKLVMAASEALKQPPEAILRWFGRAAMPMLAARYPNFFIHHLNTRSFLLTLNDIIHPEVRKLYPGAGTPEFEFDVSDSEVLSMTYQSPRKLCALAEGFVCGAADHYGETLKLEHPQCMHRGDSKCLLKLRFNHQSD